MQLFFALFVFEAQLIEVVGTTLGGAVALEAALGRVLGVGGRVVFVVDAAGDDRPIRIAFQKIDDDFLVAAGDVHAAPALAGPRLGGAHEAGAVLVALA